MRFLVSGACSGVAAAAVVRRRHVPAVGLCAGGLQLVFGRRADVLCGGHKARATRVVHKKRRSGKESDDHGMWAAKVVQDAWPVACGAEWTVRYLVRWEGHDPDTEEEWESTWLGP